MKLRSICLLTPCLFTFSIGACLAQPGCSSNDQSIECTTTCSQPIKLTVDVTPGIAENENIQKVDYQYAIINSLPSGQNQPISTNQAELAAPNDTVDYITPSRNISYELPLPNTANDACKSVMMRFFNCQASYLAAQVSQKSVDCNHVLSINLQ